MSALIAQLVSVRQQLSFELDRFMLLWRYQHATPPFALWWRLILKRVTDFAGGLLLLTVCAPVMLLLALIIKCNSPGPVLFVQERLGWFGKPFKMYKFRSMVVDAEKSTGPVWCALKNDPRITPLGRFLRKSHLDELPQLLNVVKGDMSLVGPRPERQCFVNQLSLVVPRYDERHYVKPGITGLAQVHYRYDQNINDVKKKLRFDLLYVKRMCLLLDAKILAWTLLVCVTGRGIGIKQLETVQ